MRKLAPYRMRTPQKRQEKTQTNKLKTSWMQALSEYVGTRDPSPSRLSPRREVKIEAQNDWF